MWVIGLLYTTLVVESLSVQHVHKAHSWEGKKREDSVVQGAVLALILWIICSCEEGDGGGILL